MTTKKNPVRGDAPALLIQLEACRKLLILARTSVSEKTRVVGLCDSNKIHRALDDMQAAESGILEAISTVRRLTTPQFPVSKVLEMAGLSSTSNAI